MDANHIPGSVSYLFIDSGGSKTLFTGDIRAESSVVEYFKRFAPINKLYVDLTYGGSKLHIPPRKTCISYIVERCNEHIKDDSLIIFVTYTVGKEDLIYEVAQQTQQKIYATETKMRHIQVLVRHGFINESCFEDDPMKASIHILPMAAKSAVIHHGKSLNKASIVIFNVSGWNGREDWTSYFSESVDDIVVTNYHIPYSDHSAPKELEDLFGVTQPEEFIPITTTDPKKITKLEKCYMKYIRKESNKRYIDFYFRQSKLISLN